MNPHEKRRMLQVQSKLEQAITEVQLNKHGYRYEEAVLELLKDALVLVKSVLD